MVILAFLGFTNYSRTLPLNDKFLHFTCLCVATGVFYFIFDVEEWVLEFWRSGLLLLWFAEDLGLIVETLAEFGFGAIQGWYLPLSYVSSLEGSWVRSCNPCFQYVPLSLSQRAPQYYAELVQGISIWWCGGMCSWLWPCSSSNYSRQANWLGSTLGLYLAYHIEKYYRSRREVSRFLHRPAISCEL